MGKRKSKARVITKKIASVPTQFDCLFCNHAKTVECKLNQVTNLGTIKCRVCNVSFQMEINHLHDPIDVYSEWIDETEKANRVIEDEELDSARPSLSRQRSGEEEEEVDAVEARERDADHEDEDEEERKRARQKRRREEQPQRRKRDQDDEDGDAREAEEEEVEEADGY